MKDWLVFALCVLCPTSLIVGCLLVASGQTWALFMATFGAGASFGAIRMLGDMARHGVHNDR